MMLYFDGVKIAADYMTGVVSSDELIEKFSESWIPHYQRERVLNKRKINSLKAIFLSGGKIDSIKINLIGEYAKEGRQAIISGSFRVIDGQQRLWALKESGAKGLKIPVELYLNIPEPEEIKLFHQFNRDPSKLTFGELAKSTGGSFASVVSRVIKDKAYPVRVNVNSRASGIPLGQYCALLHMVHRKMAYGTLMLKSATGKNLLKFLEDTFAANEVNMTEFAARNILRQTAAIFGAYDSKSLAWSRGFLLNWANVVVSYFLLDNGQVAFNRHKGKVQTLPQLLNNSKVREMIGINNHEAVFDAIVGHFNFKVKGERLPDIKTRGYVRGGAHTKRVAEKAAQTVRREKRALSQRQDA